MADEKQLTENAMVTLVAALMAGGTNDQQRVIGFARDLKQLVDPGSFVMKAVAEFDGINAITGEVMEMKHFTGTVLGIAKEADTSRGIVSIYTGGTHPQYGSLNDPKPHPITKVTTPGVEHVRTDRTDNTMDTTAKEFANYLRTMAGHKMNFTVKMEPARGANSKGRKIRTLIAAKDMGITKDEAAIAVLDPNVRKALGI